MIDVILIPALGGYISGIVLNGIDKLELYGWFSDKGELFDVENGIALNFFHNTLHGLMDGKQFQFAASLADCKFDSFYDQYNKIPDYIAGTLADYNLSNNEVSKKKFSTVLTDYMGDNQYNNYVFRIFKNEDKYNCARIMISRNCQRQS